MDMDLKALAKNKKAWAGVGGAAGLGLFVYYRRKKSGAAGAPGTSTAAMTGATAPGGAGATADTTGYDLASFLGNYSQSLQDQLTAGLNAIKDQNASIGTTPPKQIGAWQRAGDGTYNVHIAGGTDWAGLQTSLAGLGLNGDIATLINLNPGLMADVKNYKGTNGQWANTFVQPVDVKVPLLPNAFPGK
jgi:hypothetical protein